MVRPWRIRFAGAKYHVTVRGNGRQQVFHGRDDYERFVRQLDDALERDEVVLYAYALMPNHYHLFIETPHGNVQRFMQRLNTAYSMYHRFKHSAPGHCFQGRYGAKLISGDAHILALTRYIHLNPVKTAAYRGKPSETLLRDLSAFPWSSYRGYCRGKEKEERIDYRWLKLVRGATPGSNRRGYRRYAEACLQSPDDEFRVAQKVSRYAIGDDRFVEEVESDLRDVKENKGVCGDIVWPERRHVPMGEIAQVVADEYGLEVADLCGRSLVAREPKKVTAELCCRYSGVSQRAVEAFLGYRGNGAVNKQRCRLAELMAEDDRLRARVHRLRKRLGRG